MGDFRASERYGRLQKGLLEVFRRFSEFFKGRGVKVVGRRFTVVEFGLGLIPEMSLRGSFICKLKETAEEGLERVLSTFIELERAFYNQEMSHDGRSISGKDQQAFRHYMQLFYEVSKDVFKPEILQVLSGMEHSINVSIAKTKRLLRAERNQEIRSSSDAHHENNLKKQEARPASSECRRIETGYLVGV